MKKHIFSSKVIKWYQHNQRELPWRSTREPYLIWLSEIILQQTRVAQGMPYYLKFIEAFPNIIHFAKASQEKLLGLWQGLGYYSRARNMHKCAKEIVETHGGKFPEAYHELIKLPGIGPYTAAAIASICFEEKVAVIDGNVFRVLSRYFGLKHNISLASSREKFQKLANELIKGVAPGDFNQAVMEFGALHCKPKHPMCTVCTLRDSCYACAKGMQEMLPVKSAKVKAKHRYFFYLVIADETKVLMKLRNKEGIWEGMYDFPSVNFEFKPDEEDLLLGLQTLGIAESDIVRMSTEYKHILTHQILHAYFISLKNAKKKFSGLIKHFNGKLAYKAKHKLAELPKPILIKKYMLDAKLLS